jgi:hypothetical protein
MSALTSKNYMTLAQQINYAFMSPKGYDGYLNIQSQDGHGIYNSYFHQNKSIASGITQMNFQVSFVSKYQKAV